MFTLLKPPLSKADEVANDGDVTADFWMRKIDMYGYETSVTMNMDKQLARLLHADYDMRQDFSALLAKELRLVEITYDVGPCHKSASC